MCHCHCHKTSRRCSRPRTWLSLLSLVIRCIYIGCNKRSSWSKTGWCTITLATIDPNLAPTNASQVFDNRSGRHVYTLHGQRIYQDPSNRLWYYLTSNHQVPRSEFFVPQTAGRLPSGSVIYEGQLYFEQEVIYFDHDTRRWRTEEGNNPLPDETFQGPSHTFVNICVVTNVM